MSDVDPDLTFTFRSLRTQLDATLTHERILAMVSGFFGALALLLAACGLYGVTAYAVSRRRTEIGLRLALGARPAGILRMVLGRVAVVVLSGTVIGALVSQWLSRHVSTLIFGLTPHDPLLLRGAAGALLLVGMLAGFVPARALERATSAQGCTRSRRSRRPSSQRNLGQSGSSWTSDVPGHDPVTFATVAAVVALVALMACPI